MSSEQIHLLVIDDDPALLAVLELGLRVDTHIDVTAVSAAADAVRLLAERRFDLVITDYSLDDPNINGMEIMRCALRRETPPLVILITAFASLELTLDAIRLGAYDFLTKPFQLEELQLVVRNATQRIELQRQNTALAEHALALENALVEVETNQETLVARIDHLIEDLQRTGIVEAHPSLGHVMLADPLRRRYQDQLGAYRKQCRTIGGAARGARLGEPIEPGDEPFGPLDSSTASVEA